MPTRDMLTKSDLNLAKSNLIKSGASQSWGPLIPQVGGPLISLSQGPLISLSRGPLIPQSRGPLVPQMATISKRMLMKIVITVTSWLGAMVASYNVLLPREIHDNFFFWIPDSLLP